MCSYQFFSFFPYRRRVHRPSESGTIRRTLCAVDVGSLLTTFRRSSVRNAATPRRSLGAVSLAGSRFPSFSFTLLPKFYPLRFVFPSPSHIFPLAHLRFDSFCLFVRRHSSLCLPFPRRSSPRVAVVPWQPSCLQCPISISRDCAK